jgi:hypothetical protein
MTPLYLHARFGQLLQWDRIGFIDDTQRIICRPGTRPQRKWYSGYKKFHGIKSQGVTTPDGLMSWVCPDMLRKDQNRGTSENW